MSSETHGQRRSLPSRVQQVCRLLGLSVGLIRALKLRHQGVKPQGGLVSRMTESRPWETFWWEFASRVCGLLVGINTANADSLWQSGYLN